IKAAVIDPDGGFHHELTRPTPVAAGSDAVVGEVAALIAELAAESPAAAVGLVVPGIVDPAAGRAVFSANVGFRDLPLRDLVHDAVGLPVLLEHDVYA